MIQAYAAVNLVLNLFHLVVVGALTIVTAVRAQGRPRMLGVAGFGLLTLNQLMQMIAPVVIGLLAESPGGGAIGSGGISFVYLIPTAIGVVLGAVALVLLAMAVIGTRAGSGTSAPSTRLH